MSIDFDIKEIKVANKKWCPEVESNHRHKDFQSFALPTELSGQFKTSVFLAYTLPNFICI